MLNRTKYRYLIGIDTGVNTGFAVWDKHNRVLTMVTSTFIHRAMEIVLKLNNGNSGPVYLRIEDARQVRFGTDKHKAQGAGSVKRDAKIWEDFCIDHGIDFEMVRPAKAFTKLPADKFGKMTGYKEATNSHGRDAALLVYGY